MEPPHWFNDPSCGAVNAQTGLQQGLTCGLFAINHCLARQALPCVPLQTFRAIAGDGCYAQGDFDDAGLQRNVEAAGGVFASMQGADHEQLLREDNAGQGLQVFTQPHTAGFVIHTPFPRHWVAVVPPWDGLGADVAGVLCDSLQHRVYGLRASEIQELFALMGARQMMAGENRRATWVQLQDAASWSAYTVSF